ncbi:MAG: hypothetical protein WC692_08370 [Erythrobacter sp.]
MGLQRPEILMVYNADGGLLSTLLDSVRKVVSPSSHDCPLCKITHGAVTMRYEWRQFLGTLPHLKTSLHRDQFLARYPWAPIALPAILLVEEGRDPMVLVGREQLLKMSTVKELALFLENRLATFA